MNKTTGDFIHLEIIQRCSSCYQGGAVDLNIENSGDLLDLKWGINMAFKELNKDTRHCLCGKEFVKLKEFE